MGVNIRSHSNLPGNSRGSIAETVETVHQTMANSDKFVRGYKISEILSAAIYLAEEAGNKVRTIRETGIVMLDSVMKL